MKAADIMTRDVKTISIDATVEDAAIFLAENHISGAPVINKNGELAGIITEHDFLLKEKIKRAAPRMSMFGLFVVSEENVRKAFDGYRKVPVSEIMTKKIISFGEDDKVSDIAVVMHKHNINRVPILSEGKVAGIVSRADIVKAMAQGKEEF